MEDIRRFLHTLHGLFEKGTRSRGILGCFLGGLFLNIVIELMDRQSLSAVFVLLESHPLAFLENVLILTFFLSLCLFSKRRWFFGILIGTVWLGLGIANLYVLSYRVSPLSAIDFAILQLDWSFIGIYMSVPAFILLVIAVILLLAGDLLNFAPDVGVVFDYIGLVCFGISVLLTIISGCSYLIKNKEVFLG